MHGCRLLFTGVVCGPFFCLMHFLSPAVSHLMQSKFESCLGLLQARTAPNHLDMGKNSHMESPSSNLVQISDDAVSRLMQFLV